MALPFIIRIVVQNNSTVLNDAITNNGYEYSIDWGDGSQPSIVNGGSATEKTYDVGGTYDVSFLFENTDDQIAVRTTQQFTTFHNFVTEVVQWPTIPFRYLVFEDCALLTSLPLVSPILSPDCYISHLLSGCVNFNAPLVIDTSEVTDMSYMFYNATSFNQPLSFDTSKVTNMSGMFKQATSYNQPILFDTSNVVTMYDMFEEATFFDQPLNFDTSKVTNMYCMFMYATSLSYPITFDTSKVENMDKMLYGTQNFNHSLANLDVSNVTTMSSMLDFCGMDVGNYDLTIAGWAAQNIKPDVRLGALHLVYSDISSHDLLTNPPNNWIIEGDSTGGSGGGGGGGGGSSDNSFTVSNLSIEARLGSKEKNTTKSIFNEKASIDTCRSFFFSVVGDLIRESGYPEYKLPVYVEQLFYNPLNGEYQPSLEDHVHYFTMLDENGTPSSDEVFIKKVRFSLQSCFVLIVMVLMKMYFIESQNENTIDFSTLNDSDERVDKIAYYFERLNRKISFKIAFSK